MRLVTAVTVLLLCSNVWARDRTDVIHLKNGDRLTGEVVQLEHGKLRLETDSLGEVRIEWDDVKSIDSDFEFQFEKTDGTRITGTIDKTPEQHEIQLSNAGQTTSFKHNNVVRISQIENRFWERLKGSLTFGYSFTKASDVAQGNLGFRATHRTEVRSFTLDGSTIVTSDQLDNSTQNTNIRFNMTRFRSNRWFNTYILGFESNDGLGLDLRTSIGAGAGRFLIQTNTSEFALHAGLIGTEENLQPSDPPPLEPEDLSQQNIEGLLGVEYSRYIFDDPTVDLSAALAVFPSITDSGRTRSELDIKLRWELIKDLFWDLSYYNKYDSDPASGAASTSDYGVVTSIGYSF